MQETSTIEDHLREATSLPDTLAVSFDAFETIRMLARNCEDRVPELFAAFMTAADAAIDGREALTAAPSLPGPHSGDAQVIVPGAGADMSKITDALAALSVLLRDRLSDAATLAAAPEDRAACEDGASAAGRICQLMARGDDDARLR